MGQETSHVRPTHRSRQSVQNQTGNDTGKRNNDSAHFQSAPFSTNIPPVSWASSKCKFELSKRKEASSNGARVPNGRRGGTRQTSPYTIVRSAQQIVVYELQLQKEVEGVRREARELEKRRQKRRETLT